MFHVIVNPTSNSGRGKSQWDKIEALFKKSGVPYKVYFSSAQNSIEDICEELTSAVKNAASSYWEETGQ